MENKSVIFRIHRYKPASTYPAIMQDFSLVVTQTMQVLDCLEEIRIDQDPSLMYRHSCHHASCGTCAMVVNEKERLACRTNVWELDCDIVTLEPLNGFPLIGDLVVDMDLFFDKFPEQWSCKTSSVQQHGERFENCIECGNCVSACPASQGIETFIGPAALAAIHRQMTKEPGSADSLKTIASGDHGERWCRRDLSCSRVCPSSVYPARHIQDLQRLL